MAQCLYRAMLALAGPMIVSSAIAAEEICKPLNAFLASVQPHQAQQISFRTIWGSNFKDAPEEAIYAKRCEHGGYDPGKAICDYLMNFGVVEFSGNNVKAVITCLSPVTRFPAESSLHAIAFATHFGTETRGANVDVEFRADEEVGGMVLTIKADGY